MEQTHELNGTKLRTYYGVKRGKEGTRIYDTWVEAKDNVQQIPDASILQLRSLAEAQQWLNSSQFGAFYSEEITEAFAEPALPNPSKLYNTGPDVSDFSTVANDLDDQIVSDNGDSLETSSNIYWESFDLTAQEVDVQDPIIPPDRPPMRETPYGSEEFKTAQEPVIELSAEQEAILKRVKRGENIFFTGPAGAGKSVLLRKIISWGLNEYGGDSIAVTAATGIAALNIGGRTLHSWAGIRLGNKTVPALVRIIQMASMDYVPDDVMDVCPGMDQIRPGSPWHRWLLCRMLVVDEISMIDGKLLDKLESLGRMLRYNHRQPWGGINVIFCGDFFQLPPVPDSENGQPLPVTFAFDAESWDRTVHASISLKKVFRQKDEVFADMLNATRVGQLTDAHVAKFRQLQRPVCCPEGIEPAEIYPLKEEVAVANYARLAAIEAKEYTYEADDTPGQDDDGVPLPQRVVKCALERLVSPPKVTVKAGAQVMLVKNLVQGQLVNGSLGRVLGFQKALPAQKAGIPFGRADYLHGYIEQRVLDEILASDEYWPIVEFPLSGMKILCVQEEFTAESASGIVEATRRQIPLILAWAITIHKSQGQTLEYVRVDFARIFERGQAYVALSRATSREGLEIRNFRPGKVMVHSRVLEWMGEEPQEHSDFAHLPSLKRKRPNI